jgi:hypothetical protein
MLGSAAGNWLYSNRRWLSPADPSEKSILETNYDKLCSLHPEFRACSKECFLSHLFEVTSAWSKIMSDCSLLPIHPGDLPGIATESEIHEEIEAVQNVNLLAKKRRRASAEDGSPRPKTARKERPHDLSWLGCMQDEGRLEGMAPDHAQRQRSPPGGAGGAGGAVSPALPQAYPIAPQPRRAVPPPSAFTPRSTPRAHCGGPCTGVSGLRRAPTGPCATGPAQLFNAEALIQGVLFGPGHWRAPGADPCPAGASAPDMAAAVPVCSGGGAGQNQAPPSGVLAATARGASASRAAPLPSAAASLGAGPPAAPRGGLEPVLAARAGVGAAGPSAFTSRERPTGAFTAVVRPRALPPAAARAQGPHLSPPWAAAPTPTQSAVAGPLLRGTAPHARPPGPGDGPQVLPAGSEPAAHTGGAGAWPGLECGGGAVAACGHRSPHCPPYGGWRTAPAACRAEPGGQLWQPAWGPWWLAEGQGGPEASGRPGASECGGPTAVRCGPAAAVRPPEPGPCGGASTPRAGAPSRLPGPASVCTPPSPVAVSSAAVAEGPPGGGGAAACAGTGARSLGADGGGAGGR